MSRRTPFVRCLALLWAALQVTSPGIAAIADGQLARDNGSRPLTHVEATTTAACPVVHAPDCGVCRYLSSPSGDAPASALCSFSVVAPLTPAAESFPLHGVALSLPNGRAPPA